MTPIGLLTMRPILMALAAFPLLASTQSDFPNCTSSSRQPLWSLENIYFNATQRWSTPAHSFGSGHVSFSLASNVRDVIADCEATSSGSQFPAFFTGYEWYPCTMPENALPSDEAWFKFDTVSGKLEINQTYTCWEELGPTL